ncbi:hydroxymyristoyl-ACP dehydratase [Pseudidiomarina sp. E22-M8]|uniref:ApeI family dehydratase n=1 Tax=Pseudidiomarina sp. E22-M8 TaxID=3424768 RepID=UPI00403C79F7
MNANFPEFSKHESAVTAEGHALLKVEFELSPDCIYLQGHFPEAPILPGVTQLDWAIQVAAKQWGTAPSVRQIEVLKFNDMILPNAKVTLTLERKRQDCVLFRYSAGHRAFSSGRLIYPETTTKEGMSC